MIYLDNASTTKPLSFVGELIKKYTLDNYFNPSSLYSPALLVKEAIKSSRKEVSGALGCREEDLFFTSSATEANNLFLQGVLTSNKKEEFVFSSSEHASVYQVAQFIKNKGYTVHFVKNSKEGTVDIKHLKTLINKNTRLVSLIHVSNETGAINDIKALTKLIKQLNPATLVHSDGVQAFLKIATNVGDLGVDAYVVSAHKVYSTKGVGAIYIKNKNLVKPLVFGGAQEAGLRSGTENVAGIVAFGEVVKFLKQDIEKNYQKALQLKEKFLNEIRDLEEVVINAKNVSSPYILSLSLTNIKAQVLLNILQEKGVFIGVGSSCSSNSKYSGNRVLHSLGLQSLQIEGSVRISFGLHNSVQEISAAAKIFSDSARQLRKIISKK